MAKHADEERARAAFDDLCARHKGFASAARVISQPIIRRRPKGFASLARIMIGQQLSVASAEAIRTRTEAVLGTLSPEALLGATDDTLRAAGLSRPKIRYLRAAAETCEAGSVDLTTLGTLDDDAATDALTSITGVGPWTAAVYLLFCEQRWSVWVPKDVALLAAWRMLSPEDEEITMKAFDTLARDTFGPQPGLAAHALWTYFNATKGRAPV